MPKAKYQYRVMGKVAKNSRNKAQKEVIELLKADENHNFESVMKKLTAIETKQDRLEALLKEVKEKITA